MPGEIAKLVLPSENPNAGRVFSYGPWRSGLPGFAYSLPLSLPSAYGAYGFGGYDPIVSGRPESLAIESKFDAAPAEACRAYGVRWVLVADAEHYKREADYWQGVSKCNWCFGFSDSSWPNYQEACLPTAQLRVQREEVSLYEISEASPLAFDRANPSTPLPIEFHGWGSAVQVPGNEVSGNGPRTVVVNIAMRPWLRAASGGQPLEVLADDWGRMEVSVPDGVTNFEVFYDLPWRRGIFMALGLMSATLVGLAVVRKQLLIP